MKLIVLPEHLDAALEELKNRANGVDGCPLGHGKWCPMAQAGKATFPNCNVFAGSTNMWIRCDKTGKRFEVSPSDSAYTIVTSAFDSGRFDALRAILPITIHLTESRL